MIKFLCLIASLSLLPLKAKASFDDYFMGKGHARGIVSTVLIEKTEALKLLPAGWGLARVTGVAPHLHPITLFVGNHSDLTARFAGADFLVTKKYNEVVYTVTNVKIPGKKRHYVHASALRLDELKAIAMGVAMGMPKKKAIFEATAQDVRLTDLKGNELMVYAETKPRTYDRVKFIENFAKFAKNLQPLAVKIGGLNRCIDFNWNFDLSKVRPVELEFSMDPRFGKVTPGNFTSPSMDETEFGAVRVDTHWTMSLPRDCE